MASGPRLAELQGTWSHAQALGRHRNISSARDQSGAHGHLGYDLLQLAQPGSGLDRSLHPAEQGLVGGPR